MFKYLIFLFLISCLPQGGNITVVPGSQGAIGPGPEISTISVVGSQLIINGRNFTGITHATLMDPKTGTAKPFAVKNANLTQLISESIDILSVPVNKGLELILANAYGQITYPVTFTLQPNAVATANIQPNAVTAPKIPDAGISVSKLNPSPHFPDHGDVLAWDSSGHFMFVPFSGGGGGGGGITSVMRGDGIASPGTNITPPGGTIDVDKDVTGDATDFKIPYFDHNNKIVLDSSSSLSGQITGLNFKDGSIVFDLYNDSGFLDIVDPADPVTPLFSLDNSGNLKLKGSSVCTQATGCAGTPGSTVNKVTAAAPLGFTGTTNVIINAGAVNTANNLVKLDATLAIPASVKGVVNYLTAGTSINVSPASTGAVTVGVVFGAGNAQKHQTYLDNLGTLNPNDNYAIIGNGTSFEVQGGDTLLTTLGVQKPDADLSSLAALTPYLAPNANMIVGSPLGWITQTVPKCTSGNVVIGDGSFLDCSPNTWDFSGGMITTNNQVGMQIRAETSAGTPTGELQFFGSNNTNFVGLKAAAATASNTVWTLPAGDGANGQLLSTNASGVLSWVTRNSSSADVIGPATSTTNAIAKFSDGTGKNLANSGVLINASNDLSGVAAFSSSGNMTVDTNTFVVNATGDQVGIRIASPTYTLDIIGASNSGIHLKQGAQSTATSGGFKNGLVLEKSSAANAFALGYNTSDLFSIDYFDGTSIYKNLFTLNSSGNGQFIGSLKVGAYTLPSTDGASTQALTTNGSGAISWTGVGGANDVSNATPTTDNAIARFDGTSGKLIKNSGVIIDDSNNVTGTNAFTSSGNMTVDTNTFIVDASGNKVGILTTSPAEALDVRGNARLGSGSAVGTLKFYDGNGSNFVALQAAATVNADVTWILPPADGTATHALTTNGLGALSWTSVGGINDVSNAGTSVTGNLASFSSGTGKAIGDSGIASANVVTMNPAAGSANRILTSQGANRIATPTSVFINGSGDVTGVGNFTSTGTLSNTGNLTNTGNMIIDTDTLYVDSSGNRVGIGTTSPNTSSVLDLTSTTKGLLPPRMTTGERDLISSPANGLLIYNSTTNSFNGRVNNAWQSVTGDVGGPGSSTDNAIARFDSTTGKLIQDSVVTIADTTGTMDWPDDFGSKLLLYSTTYGLGISSGQMNLWAPSTASFNFYGGGENDTGTKVFSLTGTGNALLTGIPVTNPISTLEIRGTTDNQQAGTLYLSQTDNFGFKIYYDALNTFDGMRITERRAGTDTVRMSFKNGGNVGIGNSDPANLLDVSGTFRATGNALIGGTLGVTGAIDSDGAITADGIIRSTGSYVQAATNMYTDNGHLYARTTTTAGDTGYFIMANGNGINASFHAFSNSKVVGNAEATSYMYNMSGSNGNQQVFNVRTSSPSYVYFNGTVSASNVINRSDLRLKKSIQEVPISILEKFKDIKVIQYQWRDHPILDRKLGDTLSDKELETKIHVGVIAQDLEKIFPDFISEGEGEILDFDTDGIAKMLKIRTKGYNIGDLLALTVKVVQEQQKTIDGLNRTVPTLATTSKNDKTEKNSGTISDSSLEKIPQLEKRIKALQEKIH